MSIYDCLPMMRRDPYTEKVMLAVEARQEAERIIRDNQKYPINEQDCASRRYAAHLAWVAKNRYWKLIKDARDFDNAAEYPTPWNQSNAA